MAWGLLSLLLFVCACCVVAKDYSGWKVVRATIEKKEDLAVIKNLHLDVWSHDSNLILGQNDIKVNPEQFAKLTNLGVSYSVLVDDLQVKLDNVAKQNKTSSDWFASYHPLKEIKEFFHNISKTFPTLVKNYTIGQSVEGRNIDAFVITGTNQGKPKKQVIFTGMVHAREWISPHTVAYLFNSLVTLYPTDKEVKDLMDELIIHFIPIVNPDGYKYSWEKDRYWRKNRRPNEGGYFGVDLNRNFDDHWGDGCSPFPAAEDYCGTGPASEPEIQAVSTYIMKNGPFVGFIDFHSYGQLILRQYGWSDELPPDAAVQKTVGDGIRLYIYEHSGNEYTSERAYDLYYCTGTSDDWAYGQAGIKYTYSIELPDTGDYGFELPASEIVPTGQEIWAGMKYYLKHIIEHD